MLTLNQIPPVHIKELLTIAFENDEELLTRYHISPGTLEHCVDNTYSFIKENLEHYKGDMECYEVVANEKPIGYTIVIRNEITPNELYSFGINIKYRKKEVLLQWLKHIGDILDKPYYIVLWSKNERAIQFFEKNNFVVQRSSKLLNDETKTLIICRQEEQQQQDWQQPVSEP